MTAEILVSNTPSLQSPPFSASSPYKHCNCRDAARRENKATAALKLVSAIMLAAVVAVLAANISL